MAAAALICVVSVWNFTLISDQGPVNITAEPGQNITLPCRAPDDRPVIAVEWSRTDLGSDPALLYRNDQTGAELQHLSYQNRVDLQDRRMKDGDVSLVLKNVTVRDSGTYECRVVQAGAGRRKRSETFRFIAEKDNRQILVGGDQVVSTMDSASNNDGLYGLIALPVLAVIIAVVVCLCVKKKRRRNSPPDSTLLDGETGASKPLKMNQNGGSLLIKARLGDVQKFVRVTEPDLNQFLTAAFTKFGVPAVMEGVKVFDGSGTELDQDVFEDVIKDPSAGVLTITYDTGHKHASSRW